VNSNRFPTLNPSVVAERIDCRKVFGTVMTSTMERQMRIRGFAPATPCWVELASTDPARAQDFYARLFGWDPAGDRFRKDGRAVAGLTRARDHRPAGWLTYLAAPDLDAALEQVAAAGGHCLTWPADGHGGRAAIIADRGGAALGLWQANGFAGAQTGGEPNTMTFPELLTDDAITAADFYGRAFGWMLRDEDGFGRRGDWLTTARDAMAGLAPGARPARWRVAFQVEDCATAVEACRGLGGGVVVEPTGMSLGSYAELVDPFGAAFAVAAPATRPAETPLSFDALVGMQLTFPG
jgi:predicted enzyme related to lactoylglutathione lyase